MQAGEMRRRSGGKFLERVRKLWEHLRSRRFRSHAKGVLIVLGCMLLFSAGIFLGVRTSFKGAPASGINTPDLSAFSTSGNDPSVQEPSAGESSNGGPAAGLGGQPGLGEPVFNQGGADPGNTGAGGTNDEQEPFTDPSSQGPETPATGDIGSPGQQGPAGDPLSPDEEPFALDGIIMPASGQIIKRPGWFYSEQLGDWRYYPGVAISTTPGVEVKAAGAGVIKQIYRDDALGSVIVIGHGDRYESRYAGVSASGLVPGQRISKGQTIGITEADVLHFELLHDGEAVDLSQLPSQGN